MEALPLEQYAFRVTVPVPGIPPWPGRSQMWRDHRRPGEPSRTRWWSAYPAPMREEYEARLRAEAQAARVAEASHLYVVDLDAARCRFGARTMTLAGTLESAHLEAAVGTVLGIVRWSLWMIYAENQAQYPGGPYRPLTATSLFVRPVRRPQARQRDVSRRSAAE